MNNLFKTTNLSVNGIHYEDLSIKEGVSTFLSGPSGCGKSTLLRLFNAALSPESGFIHYNGVDISSLDTIALRKEVSLVTQEVFLFNDSIAGNFREFYKYREMPPPDEETMTRFLSICCLDMPLTADCSTLSGGEKQRVYIAIFLSLQPKVLLLDEPTSALDSKNSDSILRSILDHCKEQGITPIIISHDQSLTEKFAESKIEFSKEGCKINV